MGYDIQLAHLFFYAFQSISLFLYMITGTYYFQFLFIYNTVM